MGCANNADGKCEFCENERREGPKLSWIHGIRLTRVSGNGRHLKYRMLSRSLCATSWKTPYKILLLTRSSFLPQ